MDPGELAKDGYALITRGSSGFMDEKPANNPGLDIRNLVEDLEASMPGDFDFINEKPENNLDMDVSCPKCGKIFPARTSIHKNCNHAGKRP